MSELSTNQRRVIEALLAYPTIAEAAKHVDVTERTVYRYLQDDAFYQELRQRQDQVLRATVASVTGLSQKAVAGLNVALDQLTANARGDALTAYRLGQLALKVLKERREVTELEELQVRVAKLEEALG